ncbi:MAG TPA: response regulator transcription factor [Verrucomicrobiae bacterium]|nr:response regulator transcription factor [Verrucomicrobiae bacterium]
MWSRGRTRARRRSTHILIVEDDARIQTFLTKGLKAEGHATTLAHDGDEALGLAASFGDEFDLVLLDLGLPGTDGREVLRQLRADHPKLPVVILTARDEVATKVWGLDAGASDYITKPFAFAELLARLRAALRTQAPGAPEMVTGDLRLDPATRTAWRGDRRIELAPREWSLLDYFAHHPRQILSRSQLLSHVWDLDFDPGSNVVDVYVGYLRRKLNLPGRVPLLQAVRGVGYRLVPPDEDGDPSG